MSSEKTLDVSWDMVLKIGLAGLSLYLLYLIRDILVLIVFSLVISVLFTPAIDFIQKRGVSRALATSLVFVAVFGALGFSVYLVSLVFISEIRQFSEILPLYFERISPPLRGLGFEAFENIESFIGVLEAGVKEASSNILAALSLVFGGVFASFIIFFLAFFFSLEEKGVEKTIKILFPQKYEVLAQNIWSRSQQKITGWFGVRVLCCIFVGVATFAALKIFKVDYAASLGLFAGITNIVPFLGPIFAGTIITILVFIDDWLKAVLLLIVFVLIQQIEGSVLSPILTKKFMGLPPALVLISLIIGGKLFGFLGVVLSIPVAGILFDFLTEFLEKRKTAKLGSA